MDFFNFTKAIEQGVYDVMMWILFYPYTLVRVILRPVRMMRFVLTETNADPETAFGSAMRPALFLLISLILGSMLVPLSDSALAIMRQTELGVALADSWLRLMVFRMVSFSFFPLAGAVIFEQFRVGRMTRDSLRVPFYQQCYICAPFALVLSPFMAHLDRGEDAPVIVLALVTTAWFAVAQYLFFRRFLGFRPRNCIALTIAVLGCGWLGMALLSVPLMTFG